LPSDILVSAGTTFSLLSWYCSTAYAQAMQVEDEEKIICLGETNFRNHRRRFGIKRADRRHHLYLVGKTGTGKSTLIANLARQDVANEGLALLDPHGDLVEELARSVPETRKSDLIYFNPTDPASALAFNPLGITPSTSKLLVASGLISVFKKIWPESWGPRMEYILRNVLLALLDLPGSTLLDAPRLLDDADFRSYVVANVQNPAVRRFWLREYQKFPANFRAEAISPIQNKIGEFLVNPLLRRIVGQPKSSFDLRQVMDQGKILLVNLAKGKIGEDTAALLGAMLVTKFRLLSEKCN
jgi:Helicase HerA, central domain